MRFRITIAATIVAALAGVAGPRACSSCELLGVPLPDQRMESDYGPAECAADAALLPLPIPAEDRKQLHPPTEAALAAAREFAGTTPGGKVYFSQTTGRPMWVHADGAILHRGRPPLHSLDSEPALQTVRAFFAEHPALFGVEDPGSEIGIRAVAEDAPPTFRVEPATGRHALNFARSHHGLLMDGNGGVAFFDAQGNLLTLVARIDPTLQLDPELVDLAQRATELRSATRGELRLGRVDGEPAVIEVQDRWVLSVDPRTGLTERLHPLPDLRSFIPFSDDLTFSHEIQPIEWELDGEVREVEAPDTFGELGSVLSSWDGRTLSLGWHSTGYLADGSSVSVADAENKLIAYMGLIFYPGLPIQTVHQSWTDDPGYGQRYGAATELATNLRHTIEWVHSETGLASWDGQGASVYGAVNANPWMMPGGFFNAYAGDGYLMVGNGPGDDGRTLAAAPDVIGHEFAHLIQAGTTNLRYYGEAGAIGESVSDILGNAIDGIDESYEIAEAVGTPVRDMGSPERFDQPSTYDGFVVTTSDNGGTHTNSGILDRAAVSVWEDYDRDPLPLAELLVGALQDVPFDEQTRIEEFGAGLLAYCYVREATEPTYAYYQELCESVKRAMCTTRVLTDVPY